MDGTQNHTAFWLDYPHPCAAALASTGTPLSRFWHQVKIPIFAIILVTTLQKAFEKWWHAPRGVARNWLRYWLGFSQAEYLESVESGVAHRRTCSLPLLYTHADIHASYSNYGEYSEASFEREMIGSASPPPGKSRNEHSGHDFERAPATRRSPRSSGMGSTPFYPRPIET